MWKPALLCLTIAGCSGQPEQDNRSLAEFSLKWRTAYEAGDFDSMRDLYEPDAWLMTRHQLARKGVDEILSYFKASRAAGGKATITFDYEDEVIEGDMAVKVAKWWLDPRRLLGSLFAIPAGLSLFLNGVKMVYGGFGGILITTHPM